MSTEEIGSDEWHAKASRWAKAKANPEDGEISTRVLNQWDSNPRWETSCWLHPDVLGLGWEVSLDTSIGTSYIVKRSGPSAGVPIWTQRWSLDITLIFWTFSLVREKESLRDPQDVMGPDQCCTKAYWCPTVGEVECPDHSGFSVCCSAPELHARV